MSVDVLRHKRLLILALQAEEAMSMSKQDQELLKRFGMTEKAGGAQFGKSRVRDGG